ncbi:unnamed protein product [Amoebophrya sp. A25]|nr:unnamed protein product [Amoebophrya sp. A25]|eukprot:GSA25T00025517001.1
MRVARFSTALIGVSTTSNALLQKKSSLRTRGDGVFAKVVEALQSALADVKSQQAANDDEFTKVSCLCNEEIDEANERIPVHEENIEKAKAKLEQLRAENEKLSVESAELDTAVAKNTKDLEDATMKRKEEKFKYDLDMGDMTEGVNQMTAAIKILTEGTAFLQGKSVVEGLVQKLEKLPSAFVPSSDLALLQSGTKTSGQIIGILTNLKTTFETDMATMTAKENEAQGYFDDYADRTNKQIKADTDLSASHKSTIADNSVVIATTSTELETEESNLDDMEKQLKEQTAVLKDHTAFHDATTAAAKGQMESISGAVTLLSSPEAMKTMAKSEEHMTFPDFLQVEAAPLSKTSLLAAALATKKRAAGSYGWTAIYTAIDDMVSSLTDELEEADQQFTDCEAALKMHAVNEHNLNEEKTKRLAEIASLEGTIDAAKDTIKLANENIASMTKAITEKTQNIRTIRADTERETAEATAAHALFKKAIAFLESFSSTSVEGPKESAGAAYDTATLEAGNEKVIKIVTDVDAEMMANIKKLQDKATTDIDTLQGEISDSKDSIANSEDELAKAQTDLADATKGLNSQNRYMAKVEEGLAAEAAWWGPADGNKLPAPGEFCAGYVGRPELLDGKKVDQEGGFTATDKEQGTGKYHEKTKAAREEISSLDAMKKTIKDLESAYITPQL